MTFPTFQNVPPTPKIRKQFPPALTNPTKNFPQIEVIYTKVRFKSLSLYIVFLISRPLLVLIMAIYVCIQYIHTLN